jgi:benzoyl-CoA reductase/2-hydroxyglutaryl-CoA dehydratase subunit BcrC/BadD/HgdB
MADKDTLIVRQSQMERAIEFYQLQGIKPSAIQLLATADHFYQYVMFGMTKEFITKTKNLDKALEALHNEKK